MTNIIVNYVFQVKKNNTTREKDCFAVLLYRFPLVVVMESESNGFRLILLAHGFYPGGPFGMLSTPGGTGSCCSSQHSFA
jgi:hypothetical protein